ncbi:MAG: hypothetical protein HQ582_00630 [Planctomycetes bacterium]|nr:hypothetical protein [Planctomycetota bacterium]
MIDQLHRLAWLDERLATVGVCAMRDAKELGTSSKTVRRDLDLLHGLSPLVYIQESHGRRRWVYADRRKRVFSRWFASRASG